MIQMRGTVACVYSSFYRPHAIVDFEPDPVKFDPSRDYFRIIRDIVSDAVSRAFDGCMCLKWAPEIRGMFLCEHGDPAHGVAYFTHGSEAVVRAAVAELLKEKTCR